MVKAKLGPNANQLLKYKAVLKGRWTTVRGDYEALLQRFCLVIKLTYTPSSAVSVDLWGNYTRCASKALNNQNKF